jgi:hypothetical protein
MAKNKKTKIVQMLSPENYIIQKARSLPIYECTINADWRETGLAQVFVIRKHINENLTIGLYLVDLLCLGVKDSHYLFNISQGEYQEMLSHSILQMETEKIPYELAHNIIYAGLEFAAEYGFKPHKIFNSVSKYILEEDTDDIELIDIPCGHEEDEKPVFITGPGVDETTIKRVLAQLEKTAGPDNYYFIDDSDGDTLDDMDMSDFDLDDEYWMEDQIRDELEMLDDSKKIKSTTLQFKIHIKGVSNPAVWRRITVPSYYNFTLLHFIIQTVFDWNDAHLYQFSEHGFESKTVITHMLDQDFGEDYNQLDASKVYLTDIFKSEGQKYNYIYDFGDNWEHVIELEKIITKLSFHPKTLAGEGACPPEDCGGHWGYENLKKILADPHHPEHQEYLDWLGLAEGLEWDSNEFDLEYTQIYLEELFEID